MKQPLKERFQQLAGIKPLYKLNEQQERELQVTSADGTIAMITDPRDIGDFLTGNGIIYGETQDGGVIELSIDSAQDYQYIGGGEDLTFEPEDSGDVDKIELEDLDFETLKSFFPNSYQQVKFTRPQTDEPYYSDNISFPNLDDTMMEIGDSVALEDWKDKVSRRFGNVTIVFNDKGKNDLDKVFVSDESFNDARAEFINRKMSALNK